MSNETEAAPAESNSPVRPAAARTLCIWPAVILVALMIVTRFGPTFLEGGLAKYWMFVMMEPMVCCLLRMAPPNGDSASSVASPAEETVRVIPFFGLVEIEAAQPALF